MQKGSALLRGISIIVAVAVASFLVGSPAVFGINTQPKVTPEVSSGRITYPTNVLGIVYKRRIIKIT